MTPALLLPATASRRRGRSGRSRAGTPALAALLTQLLACSLFTASEDYSSQYQPPLSCADGLTLCDEACVDLQQDALHCGWCGHGCGGRACAGGICDPDILLSPDTQDIYTTIERAPATDHVFVGHLSRPGVVAVTVDGTDLRIPVSGTTGQPWLFSHVHPHVYWLAGDDYLVRRTDVTATALAVEEGFVTPRDEACYLSASGAYLLGAHCEADSPDAAVWAGLPDEDPGFPRYVYEPSPRAIAGHLDAIYWSNGDREIRTTTYQEILAGADPRVATTTPNLTFGLAADETHVYWTDEVAGRVLRWALDQSAPEAETFSPPLEIPVRIRLDDEHVYFNDRGPDAPCGIYRAGKAAPGTAACMVRDPAFDFDIDAPADGLVYWVGIEETDGGVFCIPK